MHVPEVEGARGHGVEEGVGESRPGLIERDEGRLADVGKDEARERQAEPGELDGALAESAEVGEQGLHAGEGEQEAAEALPAVVAVADQVLEGEVGTEGLEDGIVVDGEVVDARREVEQQPDGDDGGERRADLGRAERLQEEQEDQDGARDADDGGRAEVRLDDGDALDGAQDGLRGREDAVGHDHGDAEHADDLERELGHGRALEEAAQAAGHGAEVPRPVPFHLDGVGDVGSGAGDVGVARYQTVEGETRGEEKGGKCQHQEEASKCLGRKGRREGR